MPRKLRKVKMEERDVEETESESESDSKENGTKMEALKVFDQLKSMMSGGDSSDEDSEGDSGTTEDVSSQLLKFDIDNTGDKSNTNEMSPALKLNIDISSDESESEEVDSEVEEKSSTIKKPSPLTLSSSLQPAVDESCLYLNTDIYSTPKIKNKDISELLLKPQNTELLRKSVITSDYEKKFEIPPYQQALRQLKKERKAEKEKTSGKGWFNMPAPDLTEEKKNDLLVLQMRRALDPKRFYKAPDRRGLPKYFQTGRIIETAADFYHSRIPKKQRKETIVDELLADVELQRYNKKKYKEIMETTMKRKKGAFRHMRRQKKKK